MMKKSDKNADSIIKLSFNKLKRQCEKENFSGWDPYDGLNSKLFQILPIKNLVIARLTWIQVFKHSPINFRKVLMVPKGYNPKGIGLFLTGYCNIYKAQQVAGNEDFGKQSDLLVKINHLAELLISLQSKGFSGACWGYNFDWQSKAFFLPKYTPTVVATSFAVEALFNAYDITRNENYKLLAISSAKFILNDLNKIQKSKGYMLSYSPLDNRAVYNASLLGSKTLSLIHKYSPNEEYCKIAILTAKAVCAMQNPDGSFPHSDQIGNKWRDNFHTGFKLESLSIVMNNCRDEYFYSYIEKGFQYWVNNFFDSETGIAWYYDNNRNLIDLHCASQAISTFYKIDKINTHFELSQMILLWAINNMQSASGFFHFQRKRSYTNRIYYMRWPNAWMFYGMSYYFLSKYLYENH